MVQKPRQDTIEKAENNGALKMLEKQLAETQNALPKANQEIGSLKAQLNHATILKDITVSQASILSVMEDKNGNVEKIQINGEWCRLGELRDSAVTKATLVQMKMAMHMCKTWPRTLRFHNTGVDVNLGKDVADIINEHPTGFEVLDFWDEVGLKNDGLKAIADNLNAKTLQNAKDIRLDCGLEGKQGGQIIHTLLEKCGNRITWLNIDGELGQDGLGAAFRPFQHTKRKIEICHLSLRGTEVSKQEEHSWLKNCQVKNLHIE
eukprot:Platyproteum_vivax@DN4617_c0_g1_i1.p1